MNRMRATRSTPCDKPVCTALLVAALLAAAPAVAAERLDLETAIRYALQHNRDLATSALGVQQSRLAVRSARADFETTVKPTAAADLTAGDLQWQYGIQAQQQTRLGSQVTASGTVNAYPETSDDNWRTSVKVEIQQPLFRRFGRLANEEQLASAGEQLLAARRLWEKQKADLVVDLVRAFETIVRLHQESAADEAAATRTEKLCLLTQAREQQGHSTRVDTLRVELQRGEARARVESCQEDLFSEQRSLAELLGMPPDTEFDLVPPAIPEMDLPPQNEAVQIALQNRLDYAQALQDYESKVRGVEIARRGLYPDVDMVARYEQYGQDDTFDRSLSLEDNLTYVGFSGNFDLRRTHERIALAQSELNVESARQAATTRALSITREVQQALSAYRRSRSALRSATSNLRLARARLELARRLYAAGRGDSFAASDAEDGFTQAELALLSARSDASVTGYDLLRSLGTLLECPAELKPPTVGPRP